MQPTPKPRDIRTQPLTHRERDTNFYASKFRLCANETMIEH